MAKLDGHDEKKIQRQISMKLEPDSNCDHSMTDEDRLWEEKCRIELEIRDEATLIFGPLGDKMVREFMVDQGLLFSSDGRHEEWSRLLDASLVAERIRRGMGLEDPDYGELPTGM